MQRRQTRFSGDVTLTGGQLFGGLDYGLNASRISNKRHRFPPVAHAAWLYFRFPLSLRLVEEMLLERRIVVSYETIRVQMSWREDLYDEAGGHSLGTTSCSDDGRSA